MASALQRLTPRGKKSGAPQPQQPSAAATTECLLEDAAGGELLDPSARKPMRRRKVAISLLLLHHHRRQKSDEGDDDDEAEEEVTLVVAPAAKKKKTPSIGGGGGKERFVVSAPFRAHAVAGHPDQLRVAKGALRVVLFPARPVAEWVRACAEAQHRRRSRSRSRSTSSVPAAQPSDVAAADAAPSSAAKKKREFEEEDEASAAATTDASEVRVFVEPDWTSADAGTAVAVTAATTVADVLDAVANRRLGDAPTAYVLCWSAQGKHASAWRVADSGPVALRTFASGGALFAHSRKIDVQAAFDEWVPGTRSLLAHWGKEKEKERHKDTAAAAASATADHIATLAETFAKMSDRAVARLYELVHKPAPLPLRITPLRLHGFEESIAVRCREATTRCVAVKNQSARALFVFAELSAAAAGFTAADGVAITVVPRAVPIPEGGTRVFRIVFAGTADTPDAASGRIGGVHSICFTYTPVAEQQRHHKDSKAPKETPFVVPFRLGLLSPREEHQRQLQEKRQLSAAALAEMQQEELLAPVQGCAVDKVRFQGGVFLRKRIDLGAHVTIEKVREELCKLDAVAHPNIAKVAWHVHDASEAAVFLGMPAVLPLMTLRDAVTAGQIPDWPLRIKIAIDVAMALRHLHHFGIALGDLRPESVLVVSLSFSYLKFDRACSAANAVLGDFGSVGSSTSMTRLVDQPADSFPCVAPELVGAEGEGGKTPRVSGGAEKQPASDMFAFAMVLYALASQKIAFADSRASWGTQAGLAVQIAAGMRPNLALVEQSCPAAVLQLMQQCWSAEPAARPTADKAADVLFKAAVRFIVEDPGWKAVASEECAEEVSSGSQPSLPPQPQSAGDGGSAETILPPPAVDVVMTAGSAAPAKPPRPEPVTISLELPVVLEASPPVPSFSPPPPPTEAAPTAPTVPAPAPPPPQQSSQHLRSPTSTAPILLAGAAGAGRESAIVRVVNEGRPVQVRVAKDTKVASLLEALKRSRVQTDGRVLADAGTKVALTDDMLLAMLSGTDAAEVALHPAAELVEVRASLSSGDEDGTAASMRFHFSATAADVAKGFAMLPGRWKGVHRVLLPDCTAAQDTARVLLQPEGGAPATGTGTGGPAVELVLAAESELAELTFHLALAGEEERELTAVFHKSTTLAAAERWALSGFGVEPDTLPNPLELLGPLRNAVPDPAAVTVQACVAGVEGHDVWLRDGELVQVAHEDKVCTVLLPAAVPMPIRELVRNAAQSLGLSCAESEQLLVTTSKGVALLDVAAPVDRHFHAAQGLRLVGRDELLQVTVNEHFGVGFARSSGPTVRGLAETMGLDPDATAIEHQGVIQDPAAELVADGAYAVADVSSGSFRTVPFGSDGLSLCAHLSCSLDNLLAAALRKTGQLVEHGRTAVLVDGADGCILDGSLPVGDLPQAAVLSVAVF